MKKLRILSLKSEPSEFESVQIVSSEQAYNYIRQFYFDDLTIYESFYLLMLNRANKTIAYVKISQGGVSGTVVDLKIIAKYAIESLCSSVILAHNHPSGQTKPSDADIQMTRKIKEGLDLFDIKLIDHIILCNENFYSFADECLL